MSTRPACKDRTQKENKVIPSHTCLETKTALRKGTWVNWILCLSISAGSPRQREFRARPSEGGSKMKGRGLVLRNAPGHRQLSVCPLQAAGAEQEGPSREPVDIRSPSDSPAHRCCCGASPLGSQGICSGSAAGSGDGEPRLGAAVVPLTFSAGHTHAHMYMHRDKCHMQTWIWAGLIHWSSLLQQLPSGHILPVRCPMWMARVQCQVCTAGPPPRFQVPDTI